MEPPPDWLHRSIDRVNSPGGGKMPAYSMLQIIGLMLLLSQSIMAQQQSSKDHRYPDPPRDWYETTTGALHVEVVDSRGRPFRQYPQQARRGHVQRVYVEAQRGATYAIRVHNQSPYRVGLVIAVDGRNIISGQPSALRADERLYVLEPHQRADFRGWRSGRDRINAFYFTDAADSYAGRWGDESRLGTIAIASYREQAVYHQQTPSRPHSRRNQPQGGAERRPGTGYGDGYYDPTRQVRFTPGERLQQVVLRYRWPEDLCREGIAACRSQDYGWWPGRSDRQSQFAAPPPRRRW